MAKQVALPALKLKADAKALNAHYERALDLANRRLGGTRGCQKKQREAFAKGGR